MPAPTSTFIGRERDVERVLELVVSPSPVTTLLGPAGIGKTRLALRAADELAGRFSGGVWFVPLADARSESAWLGAVATALGDATADVGHALEARGDVLLVLDNLEQVAASAAESISRWVRLAPRARFLVTSRERLRIESEACLELLPLDEDDAHRLFVERAAQTRGRFVPTGDDERAIRELVRHLDGNPLAIELAAARTKLFSPATLLARIGQRFDLLRGGPRDRSARQISLRGAIDWSWELLDEAERRTLARASVFRGGFSLEAAEAVLEADVAQLESLVDKSLVRKDDRFVLYETIREYAAERLLEMGDAAVATAANRHALFYFERGEAWAKALRGADAISAVASLRLEVDNLLEAHRYLARGDPERAVKLALSLNALLAMRGPIDMQRELLDAAVGEARAPGAEDARQAGGEWLVRALVARARARMMRGEAPGADADVDEAVQVASSLSESVRGAALEARSRQDAERGRSERARTSIEEAVTLQRTAGNRAGEASSLALSAAVHIKQGHIADARETFEKALAIYDALGDRVAMMSLLANLGIVHHWQDRDDQARACYRAALDLAISLGDRREESVDRINLALLLVDDGELGEARSEFERALTIQRKAGHRQYVGNTVGSLGSLDLLEGDTKSARRRFEESLTIFRELGHRRYEAASHRYLGTVALEEGDLERALASLEEARRLAEEVGDFVSFVSGPLGATLALLGRAQEAEQAFARARASLEHRGEPRALVLLEIFEAFADVARGDVGSARATLERVSAHHLASDARVARRLLASAIARASPSGSHPKLTLGEEARWFQVGDGPRVDLSTRRAPRLILLRLAQARRDSSGRGLSLDEVVAAGWPGERIRADAAASRAYTAIKTLRELGLGELLVRRDDGYLIDAEIS